MKQEEKAKRYDETFQRARRWYDSNTNEGFRGIFEDIFPELKESEDERIRKALIEHCKNQTKPYIDTGNECPQIQSWIDWLEKQGEQKPAWSEDAEPQKELAETYLAVFDKKFPILPTLKGKQLADYKNFLNKCQQILGLKYWGLRPLQAKLFEKLSLLWAAWGAEHLKGLGQTDGDTDNKEQEWSEEDEDILNTIINHFEIDLECTKNDDIIRWLKSIKDRVQPKQEWSEEDEQYLLVCKNALAKYQNTDKWDACIISQWIENKLKAIRSQNWKPSDEQIKLLREVQQALLGKDCHNRFVNFMCELKRLREEQL